MDGRMMEYFVIIATRLGAVPEKVNSRKAFPVQMLQAQGLVPPGRKDVNADLAANAKRQSKMSKFGAQIVRHFPSNARLLVQLGKLNAFLLRA